MVKGKNINTAMPVSPEGFKFLGTKNGQLSSTILDEYFNKVNKEYPAAINASIESLDKKYSDAMEIIKGNITALEAKFEQLQTAFDELNKVVPVEEIASESSKSKKKSKKTAE